jgi:hypothetical protein
VSLDVELARFVLLVSVIVVAVLYVRTQRVTGGTFTPGYLAILLFAGEWAVLGSIVAFTVLTVVVVRLVVVRWAVVTKPWVYGLGVVVSTTSHAALRGVLQLWDGPPVLALFVVAGLYVTPGIIAYDLIHQGLHKTTAAIAIALAVTAAIASPVLLLGFAPQGPSLSFQGRIDPDWWWLGVTVAVWATLALRMARRLATAGYVGALFLVEIARWDTILILVACCAAGALVTAVVVRRAILTPRLRFQFAVVIGAATAWTAIYWGQRLGIDGATALDAFTIEPLLVVGLVSADLVRARPWRSVVGVLAATALIVAALAATALPPVGAVGGVALVFVVILAIARPAIVELFRAGHAAEVAGRAAAGLPPPA